MRLRTITALALLAVLVLSSAQVYTRYVRIKHRVTTRPRPSSVNKVPAVDAQIDAIRSSPDFTRIALLLRKEQGNDPEYTAAIFDPKLRRIMVSAPSEQSGLGGWAFWSPNGVWLAAPDAEAKTITLLGRNGQLKRFRTSGSASSFLWRSDSETFMYSPSETIRPNLSLIRELSITSSKDRTRNVPGEVVGLFNVQGEPQVAYLTGPRYTTDQVLHIADLDTMRERLRVPLSVLSGWDAYYVDMSPDGTFIRVSSHASGDGRTVVARTSDAAAALKDPVRAILWQDGPDEDYAVTWVPPGRPVQLPSGSVLLRSDIYQSFILDCHTGSRNLLGNYIHDVDFWESGKDWQPTQPGGYPSDYADFPQFVTVTDRGLEFSNVYIGDKKVFLLRHRMQRP